MTRHSAQRTRALLGLCATALALLAAQGTALADPCTNQTVGTTSTGGPVLFDSQGYYFDTDGSTTPFNRDTPYATFDDSGSNGPTDTPPGPSSETDSYDLWGALFVGGDADSNMYWDANDNGCTRELGGQQISFAQVNIGGLLVQRKIFVSSSGLPGARLVEYVTNPTGAPVTTSVQVGDTKSGNNAGDLGSDNNTAVRFDSSGTNTIGPNDLWAVTSDHQSPPDNSDNALAHVFDGAGGADRIDFATLTGTTDTTDTADNLAYRWDNVTIAPGQTAAFMSFEVQQAVAGRDAATEDRLARDRAQAYEAAPLNQLYAGMTDAQITAVRNWPKPQPTASLTVTPGAVGADNAPLTFSAAASAASSAAGICQTRSFSWDLGDGTKSTAESVAHQYKAGQYDVALAVTNSCGQTAFAKQHVVIADKTPPVALVALGKRTTLAKLLKHRVKERLASSENGNAVIVGTIPSSTARHASAAKISRTVIKMHTRLTGFRTKKLALKLSRKAAKRLKKFGEHHRHKTFTLRVKTTVKDTAGNAKVLTKRIKVRF